jgi:hypothetical protein
MLVDAFASTNITVDPVESGRGLGEPVDELGG